MSLLRRLKIEFGLKRVRYASVELDQLVKAPFRNLWSDKVCYSKGNEVKEAHYVNMSPAYVYAGTVPHTYISAQLKLFLSSCSNIITETIKQAKS